MQRTLLLILWTGLISGVAATLERRDSEQLYLNAIEIRQNTSATWREQLEAVHLLVHAAELSLVDAPKELAWTWRIHALGKKFRPSGERQPLKGIRGVEIAVDSHRGAVRELAKVFRDGYIVDSHHQLSAALFVWASELGDPEAQGQMGLRYSLGLQDPSVWDKDGITTFEAPDQDKALLHYYFAAMNGDNYARMVLGYRHMQGLGVPNSCWTAASYYQPVAEQVADLATKPNTFPFIERIRLHVQTNHGLKTDRQREVLQYYQYSADKGNVDAQTAVGQVLNYGTHGVQRDHAQALHYLQRAADAGDHDAMAHLGHMYANGFGTKQDLATARSWFQKAAERDISSAQYGLGYMYLTGAGGVDEDHEKAFKLFTQAANQGNADASFSLGYMHQKGMRGRKNAQKAFHYYSMAAHAGHLLAMYNAAMMQLAGKGTVKTCKAALSLLKQLAERGPNAAALQRGHEHFFRSEYSQSLMHYLEAAEMGMELGQSNAAWLMHKAYISPGGLRPNVTFSLIRHSAEQGNVASLLMMADAYLQGDGVEQDWVRSAAVYYDAYQERSAQAMFHLGYAHEFGIGVPKDLQLARRFYQMTKHTQKDAAVAVYIANMWLAVHEAWDAALPYVPEPFQGFWRRALTIEAPHTSIMGPWGGVVQRLLPTHALLQAEAGVGRVAELLHLSDLVTFFSSDPSASSSSSSGPSPSSEDDDIDDSSDTTLLIGLVIILIIVMRARQQRAAARAAQDPGGPADDRPIIDQEGRARQQGEPAANEGHGNGE